MRNQTSHPILTFALLSMSFVNAGAVERPVDIVIEHGKLVGGIAVVRLDKGDDVILRVSVDRADELHLHGYDVHFPVQANTKNTLRFPATKTGRFTAELHRAETPVVIFEIYPK